MKLLFQRPFHLQQNITFKFERILIESILYPHFFCIQKGDFGGRIGRFFTLKTLPKWLIRKNCCLRIRETKRQIIIKEIDKEKERENKRHKEKNKVHRPPSKFIHFFILFNIKLLFINPSSNSSNLLSFLQQLFLVLWRHFRKTPIPIRLIFWRQTNPHRPAVPFKSGESSPKQPKKTIRLLRRRKKRLWVVRHSCHWIDTLSITRTTIWLDSPTFRTITFSCRRRRVSKNLGSFRLLETFFLNLKMISNSKSQKTSKISRVPITEKNQNL